MSITYLGPDQAPEPAPVPPSGSRTGCAGRFVQILLFLAVILIAFGAQVWTWVGAAFGAEMNAAAVTAVQAAVTLVLLLPFAWAWRAARERAIYPPVAGGWCLPAVAGRYPAAASDGGAIRLSCPVWADRTLCPRPSGGPAQGTLYAGVRRCLAERGWLGAGGSRALCPALDLARRARDRCWISAWPCCWGLRLAPPWRSCCA